MSPEQVRLAKEEWARRKAAEAGVDELVSRIESELYDRQLDFHRDKSRFKAVLGSRRAGKTEMWSRIATIKALQNPRALIRIWHSSRLRAKDMLWAAFAYLHGRHAIPVKTNETELSITFENGAIIRLVGADKDKEAQKKRGDKTILEIILEVQNFGNFLRSMIDDVIGPSLLDLMGDLCIEGTPGPLCQGVWFEISGDDAVSSRWKNKVKDAETGTIVDGEWSCHRWTLLHNPHLPHARRELDAIKKRKRWTDDNPTYLREYCGIWVNDLTALFYKFDLVRNTYTDNEVTPWGPGWNHSLGWDLGFRDDMALVVWGWHADYPDLYEVFSWSKPGALATEVMEQIHKVEQDKRLNLIVQVADTGGGGKMYVEEVMSRYSRSFTPAKKTEKYEHVRLFNDELLTGYIKLRLGSDYQLEIAGLMRDPDWPLPDKPEAPPREEPSNPNHMCDAGLYAWRACYHYIEKKVEPLPPHPTTEAWVLQMLAKEDSRLSKGSDFSEQDLSYGFGTEDY